MLHINDTKTWQETFTCSEDLSCNYKFKIEKGYRNRLQKTVTVKKCQTIKTASLEIYCLYSVSASLCSNHVQVKRTVHRNDLPSIIH